jgi:hypothetical protein
MIYIEGSDPRSIIYTTPRLSIIPASDAQTESYSEHHQILAQVSIFPEILFLVAISLGIFLPLD